MLPAPDRACAESEDDITASQLAAEQRRDRELAELRARVARAEGVQLGLGGAIVVLLAVVVWAVFFRPAPAGARRGPTLPALRQCLPAPERAARLP